MELNRIDFLIIGAAKCATTWLQRGLQLQPSISMPDPELHFFSREYQRGTEWYLSQFGEPEPGQIVGEKSNSYLDTPEAAWRIRGSLPNAKLIVKLRNPIERAYSDYCMLLRRGEVGRNIEDVLDPRVAGGNRFLYGGRYGEQLRRFADLFPREQICVVLYDDLARDPAGHLRRVMTFLGVDEDAVALVPPVAVKDKRTPIVPPGLRGVLAPFKPLAAPLRQTRPFAMARALVAREMRYPELTETLRRRLEDYYRDEADDLAAMVGRDVRHWFALDGAAECKA